MNPRRWIVLPWLCSCVGQCPAEVPAELEREWTPDEAACADRIDNDSDGFIDCEDAEDCGSAWVCLPRSRWLRAAVASDDLVDEPIDDDFSGAQLAPGWERFHSNAFDRPMLRADHLDLMADNAYPSGVRWRRPLIVSPSSSLRAQVELVAPQRCHAENGDGPCDLSIDLDGNPRWSDGLLRPELSLVRLILHGEQGRPGELSLQCQRHGRSIPPRVAFHSFEPGLPFVVEILVEGTHVRFFWDGVELEACSAELEPRQYEVFFALRSQGPQVARKLLVDSVHVTGRTLRFPLPAMECTEGYANGGVLDVEVERAGDDWWLAVRGDHFQHHSHTRLYRTSDRGVTWSEGPQPAFDDMCRSMSLSGLSYDPAQRRLEHWVRVLADARDPNQQQRWTLSDGAGEWLRDGQRASRSIPDELSFSSILHVDDEIRAVLAHALQDANVLAWYSAAESEDDAREAVFIAKSRDGLTWTAEPGEAPCGAGSLRPVVCSGPRGEFDADGIVGPSVRFTGKWFVMTYVGRAPGSFGAVGLAFSRNGVDWVRHERGPILDSASLGLEGLRAATLLWEEDTLRLWTIAVASEARCESSPLTDCGLQGPVLNVAYATAVRPYRVLLDRTNGTRP